MPFRPLRLLLVSDESAGLASRLPTMVKLLEDRAFQVDRVAIDDAPTPVDLSGYAGIVLGTPCTGLGIRGVGPTERVKRWVEAQGSLEGLKVAVFCTYQLRPGHTLRNTRQLVLDAGGQVVVTHAYPLLGKDEEEHVLPAECMVRIR